MTEEEIIPWTEFDLKDLTELSKLNIPIKTIAYRLRRDQEDVVNKITELGITCSRNQFPLRSIIEPKIIPKADNIVDELSTLRGENKNLRNLTNQLQKEIKAMEENHQKKISAHELILMSVGYMRCPCCGEILSLSKPI